MSLTRKQSGPSIGPAASFKIEALWLAFQTIHRSREWISLFLGEETPYSVEVKLAFWNKSAWRVNRVTRKKDDLIAIVFPGGHVQVEAMKDHLKLCNASGDRYITLLGRFFE